MMRSLYSGLVMLALILALVLALGSMASAQANEKKPKPIGATTSERFPADGDGLCVEDDPRWFAAAERDLIERNRRAALDRIENRLDEVNGQLHDLRYKIAGQATVGFVFGIAASGFVIGLLFLLLQRTESR